MLSHTPGWLPSRTRRPLATVPDSPVTKSGADRCRVRRTPRPAHLDESKHRPGWPLNHPATAQPVNLDVLCPGRMDASWHMLPAAARLQNAPRRYQPVIVRHHPPLCRFLVIVRGMRLERGADSRPQEAGWRCRHRLSRLPPELRQDCETDNANHCQRDCTNQHYTSSFEGQSGNHPLTFAETGYGRGLRSIP